MAARERMQVARRHDPYPWTWEPFVGWALALLMVVLLGVQVGRGLANGFAGAGFTRPVASKVVTSVVGVLRGDAAAGLAHPHHIAHLASAGAVYGWVIAIEVLALVAYGVGTFYLLRTWGPWRVLGMATREEAERLLGRTRLRKVASVVRPDLYGRAQSAAAQQVVYRDADDGSSALGRGLSKRFLPVRNHDDIAAAVEEQKKTGQTGKTRSWL
ncbi:MAG: hypothetical protein QM655_12900 [Nocardioidaceae bacterium]